MILKLLGLDKPGRSKGGNVAAVDRYCDVAGFSEEGPVFYGHDASDCTLIEIEGVRTIVSAEELANAVQLHFVGGIAQTLKSAGHTVAVSYESSSNADEQLEALLEEQLHNAGLKGLNVDAIAEEGAQILRGRARRERVLLAIWTSPKVAQADEVARERAENDEGWRAMPPARNAQTPYLALEAVAGPHAAAVRRVVDALERAQLKVRVLGPDTHGARQDLAEVRRGILYHETPAGWAPFGPADRTYPGAKERIDGDTSELFAPPVAQQILSSGAKATANLRAIAMGGREFAVVAFSVFPKIIEHFNAFAAGLLAAHGGQGGEAMPFRVCFHFEDIEGAGDFGLRKVLAGLASWTSPGTKNLFDALRTLQELHERDVDTIVKARLIATTWIEPGEPRELLERRRSRLVRQLMTWGDAIVLESPHNPMRALAETVPGMTMRSVVPPATLAPLSHVADMLPFHRTASIFERGQSVLISPDGKLMPHEAFSSAQNFWLTLIYATPGSGKSMLLNLWNTHFSFYVDGSRLPFVGVIDVGPSSRGYIELVRNALPEERRHEALYVRLQNTAEHAINPLELGLGRRYPLAREMVFIEAFLATLLGIDGEREPLGRQLISRIISRLYQTKSDLELSESSASWQGGVDPELDAAAAEAGIALRERTRWWQLVDGFMAAGKPRLAMRAQRHASPRLHDISSVLNEQTIREDFPAALIQVALRSVESAIDKYPIFAQATRLDVGDARVMSIDLQDVVHRFKGEEAERANTLFFMAARHAFIAKIAGHQDEINAMDLPSGEIRAKYVDYWRARYSDMAETKKRLAMDEFHLTGATPGIAQLVMADAREGRKWGLEIILVSQLLSDFASMKDMASTVAILNSDSAHLRDEAQQVFGFTDAVREELEREVHGPRPGRGASFLVRYMLKEEERWAVLTNLMGPRAIWALTTRQEDRLVRDELYTRLPMNEALRLLALRYPGGSAADHWERATKTARGSEVPIATLIVDQIMGELLAAPAHVPRGSNHLIAAQ